MLNLILTLALSASPTPAHAKSETKLVLDVKPADVEVYLDDKKLGPASKTYTVTVKPGAHQVKLTRKKDRVEEPVTVNKGETKTWHFDMGDSGASTDSSGKPVPTLEPTGSPGSDSPSGTAKP